LKSLALSIAIWSALGISGCKAPDPKEAAEREWQRSECNRVVDREDRERCLKRVD